MNNAKPKAIVSLFDLTGGMVRPWADAGYDCFIFDAQHPDGITFSAKGLACFGSRENAGSLFINTVGGDASTWAEPIARIMEVYDVQMVFGFPPCTSLAVSGARWYKAKAEANPNYLAEAMALVYLVRDIGEAYAVPYMVENPISVISSEWRKPDHMFNPCDFGQYLPEDDQSRYPDILPARDAYTKKTCLWTGNGFVMPEKRGVEPEKFQDKNGLNYSGAHWKLGGKSLRTKNIRSATPRGFARAVFQANTCKAGHKFEYAYDLNYDASGNVASLADQYRCARCGAIDTVE